MQWSGCIARCFHLDIISLFLSVLAFAPLEISVYAAIIQAEWHPLHVPLHFDKEVPVPRRSTLQ